MDVLIQEAASEHFKGIHQLVLEWGYTASEPETSAWLDELLKSPTHQVYVAVSDHAIVGWVVAEKRLSLGEGFTCEITGLVVSSGCRRAGLGRLLVTAVEAWSQKLGLSRVVVRSNVRRAESHEFYPSVGFGLMKTTHVYVKDLKASDRSSR